MNYEDSIKKWLVGLVVLVAIAIGGTMIASMFMDQNSGVDQNKNADGNPSSVAKTKIADDKLPSKMPANIPQETGAQVTDNFTAVNDEGLYQATREFETSKSLAENLTLYTNYLKNNDWDILSTIDKPTLKSVVGSRGADRLQVTITENSSTKIKTVTISFSQLP